MLHFTATERFFMFAPEPWLGLAMLLVLIASAWLGLKIRSRWSKLFGQIKDYDAQLGYIVSVVSGLLSLLLGFTFAMAIDRFDARGLLVIDEANAVSSTYLMAQTFPEPHRTRLSQTLVSYVDNRLAIAKEADFRRRLDLMRDGEDIKTLLWAEALAATASNRDDVSSTFLQNATEMLAIGAAREVVRRGRIPLRVHMILLFFSATSIMVLSFAFVGPKKYFSIGILVVLLILSLLLIIDLDRPVSGGVREPQRALENLRAQLARTPPARYEQLQAE